MKLVNVLIYLTLIMSHTSNYFTSLRLDLLICKLGIIMRMKQINVNKESGQVPSTQFVCNTS